MEINKFLKNKVTEQDLLEFADIVPAFILKNDDIVNELKKIDSVNSLELFNGIFSSLNQLGEKLFSNTSSLTYIDEFKQKILTYNPKAEEALFKINDLILSDIIGASENEYKDKGIQVFFSEKFDLKIKKQRKSPFET